MNGQDRKIIEAMRKYGGSFVKALAQAALLADDDNFRRIRETWPEYWFKYSTMTDEALRQIEPWPVTDKFDHSKVLMDATFKALPKC